MRVIKVTEANKQVILEDAAQFLAQEQRTAFKRETGMRLMSFKAILSYNLQRNTGEYYGHYYPGQDDCHSEWYTFLGKAFFEENYFFDLPEDETEWFDAVRLPLDWNRDAVSS